MDNKAVRMNGIDTLVDYSGSEYCFGIKSASEELDAIVSERIEEVLAGLTLDGDKPQVTVDFCIKDEGAFAHLIVLHPSLEFGEREFYSPITLTDAELEIMRVVQTANAKGYRQNEIEENEFEKQENARDKQQLEWERAEIKRYRELAKAELVTAQRANKQLDTSAACAVQSIQTFENCILSAQEPLCKQEESTVAKQRMRICIGYNDDGTQVIKQISAQNEIQLADKAVQEILKSERSREFIVATGGITSAGTAPAPAFKAYTEKYFAIYRVPRLKKTSIAFYRGWLKHFYSEWEDTPIDKITTQGIQNFLNARKKMSQKSLKDMLTFLKLIFKSALKDGVIQSDPADDNRITIPSTKKKKRKALKADDVKDIIQQLPKLKPMDRRFMALSVYNGLRRGEILGLRWEDIDLETKTIHIRRNVTFAGGVNDPSVGTTKTESGERDIPFIPEMLEYLSPLGVQGYVIGDGDRPITHSVDRRMREHIAKTIDAHGATSHVLRHPYVKHTTKNKSLQKQKSQAINRF